MRRHAFTLIELLVVIAIIALLIGLLLPAIAKSRLSAWHVVSHANIRSICQAAATYQDSYKGFMPVVPNRPSGRGQIPESQMASLNAICSWGFGGKNNNGKWATTVYPGLFDHEAADRPLNSYLYPSIAPEPRDNSMLPPTSDERRNLQMPVYRDPSDKASYQQKWNQTQTPNPHWPSIVSTNEAGYPINSYDDVGSSYHANLKWHEQLAATLGGASAWQRAFYGGLKRLKVADSFSPSRFAWIHDQYADICVYNPSSTFTVRNGYGDMNRSIMGFMDGHAAYLPLFPGRQPKSYQNEYYTFIFPDLRIP